MGFLLEAEVELAERGKREASSDVLVRRHERGFLSRAATLFRRAASSCGAVGVATGEVS
jgi:hypothetical protein